MMLPSTSRYELLAKIAAGGMATVYVGRSRRMGGGVTRLFAVKRAHPHLLDDAMFRKMFAAEARLASRIHHPNVVAVQDVEELDDELLLVMDYIEGLALSDLRLHPMDERARIRVAIRIVLDACAGLHAAHNLRAEDGSRLDIIHRDISPHNVLVGIDGVGRLTDFGIAKTSALSTTGGVGTQTVTGGLKGKIGYMAPEYVESSKADQRADIFGLGVVLWEAMTNARLFQATNELELMKVVLACEVAPPSSLCASIPRALDDVVLRALARSPTDRFASALELADALERASRDADLLATHREVGAAIEEAAHDAIATRRAAIGQNITPEAREDDFASYEGHDRTRTLDPTVKAADRTMQTAGVLPPAPALATMTPAAPRKTAPKFSQSSMSALMTMGVGVIVVVLVWLGVTRFRHPPVDTSSSLPPPPSSIEPTFVATPSSPPPPTTTPPTTSVVTASEPSPIPSAKTTRRVPVPKPTSKAIGVLAATTDHDPPSHAPPNPYLDGGT